ncbi:MAG: hypothetical protein J7M20_08500 [Deltaproteobacteria bacterium]|nr:hypothetical protein [Deltaproteobacteria bacterium]
MKCPKCNYTSFDYNQVCPKCGNDNAEEQTRLRLSPNKPNPPFFLTSLVGMADTENLEIPDHRAGMGSSEGAPGGMDAQDLLISLDDPDSAEDEILFDLEPVSEENEFKSIDSDPLNKKSFSDVEGPNENRITVDVEEIPEKAHEVDLFLTDEPDSAEEDEIVFELEETSEQESAPAEKEPPDEKGFWNSDAIKNQLAALDLEEATTEEKDASPKDNAHGKEDVNLFSDKNIGPLDLELSLEDMGEKPE